VTGGLKGAMDGLNEIMDEFNGTLWMGSYDDIEGSFNASQNKLP